MNSLHPATADGAGDAGEAEHVVTGLGSGARLHLGTRVRPGGGHQPRRVARIRGHAEVEQPRAARRIDMDVRRLDVPVHDAAGMRVRKRIGNAV